MDGISVLYREPEKAPCALPPEEDPQPPADLLALIMKSQPPECREMQSSGF